MDPIDTADKFHAEVNRHREGHEYAIVGLGILTVGVFFYSIAVQAGLL